MNEDMMDEVTITLTVKEFSMLYWAAKHVQDEYGFWYNGKRTRIMQESPIFASFTNNCSSVGAGYNQLLEKLRKANPGFPHNGMFWDSLFDDRSYWSL